MQYPAPYSAGISVVQKPPAPDNKAEWKHLPEHTAYYKITGLCLIPVTFNLFIITYTNTICTLTPVQKEIPDGTYDRPNDSNDCKNLIHFTPCLSSHTVKFKSPVFMPGLAPQNQVTALFIVFVWYIFVNCGNICVIEKRTQPLVTKGLSP